MLVEKTQLEVLAQNLFIKILSVKNSFLSRKLKVSVCWEKTTHTVFTYTATWAF